MATDFGAVQAYSWKTFLVRHSRQLSESKWQKYIYCLGEVFLYTWKKSAPTIKVRFSRQSLRIKEPRLLSRLTILPWCSTIIPTGIHHRKGRETNFSSDSRFNKTRMQCSHQTRCVVSKGQLSPTKTLASIVTNCSLHPHIKPTAERNKCTHTLSERCGMSL